MTTATTPPTGAQGTRLSPQAWLWASMFVLVALILMQAGRLGPSEARADLVTSIGDLTALTVEATNDDVLLVVDDRSESLMAYKVVAQNSVELFKTYSLPRLFGEARNRAGKK
jgi:hypothetical protein